jgi:NTP pyrophosphatase (non-canonical NTP hydrolase)|nr:MAG TPA: NTP-PPase-like protein [Bacteriophage sp.]
MQCDKYLGLAMAMRTNDKKSTDRLEKKTDDLKIGNRGEDAPRIELGGVINAALGLSGEVGELNDMLKKWVFHEKQLDFEHLKREISDVCWYLTLMCDSFEFNLDEIMQINIDKLKARYPQGFDTYKANHRQAGDV